MCHCLIILPLPLFASCIHSTTQSVKLYFFFPSSPIDCLQIKISCWDDSVLSCIPSLFLYIFYSSLKCHTFPFLLTPTLLSPSAVLQTLFTTAAMFHLTQIHLPHLIHVFPLNNLSNLFLSLGPSHSTQLPSCHSHCPNSHNLPSIFDEPKYLSSNNACLGEVSILNLRGMKMQKLSSIAEKITAGIP